MAKVQENNATKTNGIGFCGLLTILFVGLKLTHFIDWSWFWVVSPLWIPLAIVIGVVVLIFLWGVLGVWIETMENKKKEKAKNTIRKGE